MKFPDSKIAHKYLDGLRGIEIGGSSHNPFHLNTINVDSEKCYKNYIDEQTNLAGSPAKIDVFSDACNLPFKNKEFDFVISSHVIDRIFQPDIAIKEWCRIANKYIFLIIPHKDRTSYKNLPETKPEEIFSRKSNYRKNALKQNDIIYDDKNHNIWTTQSFVNFISHLKDYVEIVEVLDKDDKVGNGFCVVLKIKDKNHNKNLIEINNEASIDYLIISNCDEMLFFHNVALFRDIMQLIDKKVFVFKYNEHNSRPLMELLECSKHIILYRTLSIPDEIMQIKKSKGIRFGYLIDDNVFYEDGDNLEPIHTREAVRNCLKLADYCMSYTENLVELIKQYNPNSYYIGAVPLWRDRYKKLQIIEPEYKNNENITVGVISGLAHANRIEGLLNTLVEASSKIKNKIKVIYFSKSPFNIVSDNIIFEHHEFKLSGPQEYYNTLHSLGLDLIYVEYPDHVLMKGKSNLKFRESAYMGIPLVALDPTGEMYPEIINGINGYSVQTKNQVIDSLKDIFNSPYKIKQLGETARKTLMKNDPMKLAIKLDKIFEKIYKNQPTIQVFKPLIRQEAIDSISETIKSGWLGCGPKTKQFENKFKNYLQSSGECIATMSCTDALEIAVKLIDIREGDEIISTPITFISTSHAILYSGATPVFADVDKFTGNILPVSIESKISNRTKAIMIVHLSGYACDMESIEKIAKEHNLKIIEDCAHATGGTYYNGKYKGKKIGSSDNICCFSFQSVKNLPVGDGGMLIVPKEFLQRANRLRWMGIDKDTYSRTTVTGEYLWKYDVPELGIKANQNDIMSCIGLVQLKYIDEDNNRRREIAKFYKDKLSKHHKIKFPTIDIETSATHFYPIYVDGRDELLLHLRENNIFAGVHYRRNDKYANYKMQNLPNAEYIEKHTLTLPIHLHLTDKDLKYIVQSINDWK